MHLDSATFDEVLLAVKARLQEKVTGCNDANCWLCLDASTPANVPAYPGGFGYAIAPYNGTFHGGAFEGGGGHQVGLDTGFSVVVWSAVALDSPGKDTIFLTDKARGALQKAGEVLAALCGGNGWRPQRKLAESGYLTTQCVFPSGMTMMRADQRLLGGVQLNFQVAFDWRLEVADG